MHQEIKICQNCKRQFTIEPDDFDFYEKLKVPPPTFCPECRLIRRLAHRNERSLFKRKCNLCNQEKIVMFPPESPLTVYCKGCWWGDGWDVTSYGRDYDFSKPFFEQFRDLWRTVPALGTIQQGNNVDSEYTNRASNNRNCYLLFGSNFNENCFYGSWLNDSKDSLDCYSAQKSDRCFECVDCIGCYNLTYSRECNSCSNSAFLLNCRNCDNCFGCVNLRNKSYCIFNRQYGKEEYKKVIQQYNTGSALLLEGLKAKFTSHATRYIVPALVEHHSTGATGNWLEECKNTQSAFSCRNIEDGKYLFALVEAKDVMDYSYWGRATELIYEAVNIGYQCSRIFFSVLLWNQVIDARYSTNCHNAQNLFGCVGIKNKQYSILNKQYTKEEYESMIPRIIEHMNTMPYRDSKGRVYRYGDAFPLEFSLFSYNETIAQEYFPLTKEKANELGYPWKEEKARDYKITLSPDTLPDNIRDVNDTILNETIGCSHEGRCDEQCTTAFRIVLHELSFYRSMNLSLPRLCPNCRHYQRLRERNPLKLWPRQCQCAGEKSDNGIYTNTASAHQSHGRGGHCQNEFETSYSPERPEIVYCESCYNNEVV